MAAEHWQFVLVTMADGSDEPGSSTDAWARPAGADVVAASRYMHGGRQIGGPRLKRPAQPHCRLSLH